MAERRNVGMNIKKWFGNLLLGVCLLTFVTMLCGFGGGGVSCVGSNQFMRYEFGAEKNSSYVAYESGEGTEQTLTVYVPLGQDTQILLKAVLTPEEGFSLDDIIKDYYGEAVSWKFSADNGMPDGLTFGESDMAVQETENHVVVTAVVTVPSQTVKKSFDPATITLKNDGGTTLDADSMYLKVTAMDMTCALCGGQV